MNIIFTCEHAGNYIPEEYSSLFKGAQQILNTHRGIDFGALELAKNLAAKLHAPLHYTMVGRLLIEANRSEHSPDLFSEFSSELLDSQKKEVKEKYYYPYRLKVENLISSLAESGDKVVHISVHSFTPVFKGEIRDLDIGLLFDPDRSLEAKICEEWNEELKKAGIGKVKMNEPYKGTDDGFTTYFRSRFPEDKYAGIEIEVNQKFPLSKIKKDWTRIMQQVGDSLKKVKENALVIH